MFCLLFSPAITTIRGILGRLDYMDLDYIALTIRTFVDRVVSLLLKILSRFVIAFMPKSNRLLISWLQSPSTVILEPKKREPATTSTFSPFYLQSSNGAGCHDLSFFFFNI